MTTFLLPIACGIVGGLLFFFLHIPGGAMLGAVVAVLAVKLLGHVEADTPRLFQLGAQIAIGVMVGNMMTGGTLLEIRAMAPLMFGSTALLVVAGALGAWFIFRSAGLDAGSAFHIYSRDRLRHSSPNSAQALVAAMVFIDDAPVWFIVMTDTPQPNDGIRITPLVNGRGTDTCGHRPVMV